MSTTSPPRLEFSCLPDEVVRLIAIYLTENDSSLSSLKSLAMVNERVYNTCRPLLWKELQFPVPQTLAVSKLLKVLLPKHGRSVLSISSQPSNQWLRPPNRLESELAALHLSNQWYRQYSDVGRSESTGSGQLKLPKGHLTTENVKKILSHCPNLRRFDVCFGDINELGSPMSTRSGQTCVSLLRGLVTNLAHLQRLRHLGLNFQYTIHMSACTVAEVLLELPLLESLELRRIKGQEDQGQGVHMLGEAISSLKHLAKLDLNDVVVLNATWPTCLTLEDLTMVNCNWTRVRPSDTPRFINAFAPNLRRLTLKNTGRSCWDRPIEDMTDMNPHHFFLLPHLVDVYASSDTPGCRLMNSFKNCAELRHIYYRHVPHGRLTKRFSSFADLLCASVWPRLETLSLCYRPAGGDHIHDEHSNQTSNFCRAHDIKLALRVCS